MITISATHVIRLLEVAERWQEYHKRGPASALKKAKEEIAEFEKAVTHLDKLDELGDVVVNTLRALITLAPAQMEFICQVMEMKADRRITSFSTEGSKDKAAEAVHTKRIADILGLK